MNRENAKSAKTKERGEEFLWARLLVFRIFSLSDLGVLGVLAVRSS
jgi:hypothetical protein